MNSKEWWKSKAVWAGVVTVAIAVWNVLGGLLAHGLPPIPAWVFALLGSLGVYGRISATTTIK